MGSMEYKVIECYRGYKSCLLETEVNKATTDGWKPIGGITSYIIKGDIWLCQAMIKEDEPERPTPNV